MNAKGTMGEKNQINSTKSNSTYPDSREESSLLSLSNANHQQSLRDCVEAAVSNYFDHLDGQAVSNVYDMVLNEVEAPLLKLVMKYADQNQTKASSILGLNRGTLRKKLKKYGL